MADVKADLPFDRESSHDFVKRNGGCCVFEASECLPTIFGPTSRASGGPAFEMREGEPRKVNERAQVGGSVTIFDAKNPQVRRESQIHDKSGADVLFVQRRHSAFTALEEMVRSRGGTMKFLITSDGQWWPAWLNHARDRCSCRPSTMLATAKDA